MHNETSLFDRALLVRYANHRKDVVARLYANIAQGPGDAPTIVGASCAGIDLAVEKLVRGGIAALEALIAEHEATDRVWQSAVRIGRAVSITDKPIDRKRVLEHGYEIREMKRMLKFALRITGQVALPPVTRARRF